MSNIKVEIAKVIMNMRETVKVSGGFYKIHPSILKSYADRLENIMNESD